jgi:lambda family phage portal protein
MRNDLEHWSKRLSRRIGTFTDNVIFTLSPKRGNDRMGERRAREVKEHFHQRKMARLSADRGDDFTSGGGFNSAQTGRDAHTWLVSRLSPNSALEMDLEKQRERSDSAYKNYPLFAGHVERRVMRVAGTGIMIAPQIKPVAGRITDDQAKEWNTILRDDCERWSLKAGGDIASLNIIQRQCVRHIEKDGVAYVQFGDVAQPDPRIPISLRLKVIHPRRVETPPALAADPNVRLGHKFDEDGNLLGYFVRTVVPGDSKNFEYKHEFIEAYYPNGLRRMVHIGEPREAEQTIGYPQGQVSLSRFKNAEEYDEAELERNIVASCFTAFVKGAGDPADMAAGASIGTDRRNNRIQELSPGRVEYLNSEEDGVDLASPPGPQATFAPYMEHQGRMAAAGCCTSYEMMSGIWAGVSYSGGKLIWVDEQCPIDCGQLLVIEQLLIPTWQHFVNREITTGRIDVSQTGYAREPQLYERCKFVPPKRPSIDPARERASALADIGCGITPHADDVEQMNGRPAEDVYADIKTNIDQLAELGISLVDLRPTKGGTPLGGTNQTAAEGGAGRKKREAAGAGA